MSIRAFCSYSRKDLEYQIELKAHLAPLEHLGLLEIWDDQSILAGQTWRKEIDRNLEEAQLILLLLSPNFMDSEECMKEMVRALARHMANEAYVVPILLRRFNLTRQPVADLQIVPENRKPVLEWENRHEAWEDVSKQLQAVLQDWPGLHAPRSSPQAEEVAPIHLLLEGLEALPSDLAQRVESFLHYYIGPGGAPFGGRTDALRELDRWLAAGSSSPGLLLTAPGGKGKSALLAHWVSGLVPRKDLGVAYFPVSIRFQTHSEGSLFSGLGARLSFLYGQRASSLSRTSEDWHRFVRQALARPLPAGRRLLLVLDGLDELLGPEVGPSLLPPLLPDGWKVVISVRELADRTPTRWLQLLGWDRSGLATTQSVGALTYEGLLDTLSQLPALIREQLCQQEVAEAIYRVTEGDPLLLGLYIDELSRQPELARTLERLKQVRPGLDGYFDRWWKEQQQFRDSLPQVPRQILQALLGVLACALGPLSRQDLNQLLEADVRQLMDDALAQLGRLLIGDGLHQGYTFTHPRLSEFIRDKYLPPDEQRAWSGKLLAWGRKTLDALLSSTLLPRNVSPYLIRNYGMHLELAGGDSHSLMGLLDDAWMRASKEHDRTYASFNQDIERAWRAIRRIHGEQARTGAPITFSDEVRCGLARAGLHGLTRNFTPPLIELLVRTGLWSYEEGLVNARRAPSPRQRALGLLALSQCAPDAGSHLLQREALQVALSMGKGNDPAHQHTQVKLLLQILPRLAASLVDQVLDFARGVNDLTDKVKLLSAIARLRPEPARSELVEEALTCIRQSPPSYSLFTDPLVRTFQNEKLEKEEKRLQRNSRELCLAMLGADLIRTHASKEPEAAGALRITNNWRDAEKALQNLAKRKGASERVAHALAAWACDADEATQIAGANMLPEAALPGLVGKTTQLYYEWARAAVLESVSHRLSQPLLKEALSKAKSISELRMRAKTLAVLGLRLRNPKEQEQVAREAAEVVSALTDKEKLRAITAALVRKLPDVEQSRWTQAVAAPLSQQNRRKKRQRKPKEITLQQLPAVLERLLSGKRSGASTINELSKLAPRLDPSSMERVLEFIANQDKKVDASVPFLKAKVLDALVPYLPTNLFPNAIVSALSLAPYVIDGQLRSLLSRFPDKSIRRMVVVAILHDILNTKSNYHIAPILKELSPFLSAPLAEYAFNELTGIPTIRSWDDRAMALAALVPVLGSPSKVTAINQALSALRNDEDQEDWEDILARLAPHLLPDQLAQAVDLAISIRYLPDRIKALAALSQCPQGNRREELLVRALADAVQINRSEEFEDDHARQDALGLLIPLISQLPRPRQYELWSWALEELSKRPREELLDDLPALAPVFLALGGTREVEQIIQFLLDARQWWS